MKNKTIYVILSCLGVILLSLASSLGYHAVIDNAAEKDSTQVSALVDSLQETDLVMTSIDEVIQDHREFLSNEYYDSVYLSIPEEILVSVTKVVLGRLGKATVPDIVQEYLKNFQTLYRFLPASPEQIPETPAVAPQNNDSVKIPATKDTVINGEHYTIMLQ